MEPAVGDVEEHFLVLEPRYDAVKLAWEERFEARYGFWQALDRLGWLARTSDHIPDPGQHRTILYGHYANRTRGARGRDESKWQETAEPPRRGCWRCPGSRRHARSGP